MKRNIKINRLQLFVIILIIIVLETFIIINFSTDINQNLNIFYKTISKKINLNKEISNNEILMGITNVTGEGIIINILDGSDLRVGGAKAISINENRITNLTDIMDINNNYILVNSIPISEPYVIKVIGNQKDLEENLNYNNSYLNKIKNKENKVEIYENNRLIIKQYQQKRDKDKMNFEYLKELN